MLSPYLEAVSAILGLLFGSFLNVCIMRLPRGESIVSPRSHCRVCNAPIRWYDNLPLLSYLALRARCRTCHARIAWRYPAVELAVAVWFLLVAHRLTPIFQPVFAGQAGPVPVPFDTIAANVLQALGLALLGWLLIGLAVTDWQTQILPDALTLSGLAAAFFLVCLQAIFLGPNEGQVLLTGRNPLSSPGSVIDRGNVMLTGPEALVGSRLVAIAAAALTLLAVRWIYRRVRGREGLGLGDVKLLAMIAAFLGFAPAMLSLFAGVLTGSLRHPPARAPSCRRPNPPASRLLSRCRRPPRRPHRPAASRLVQIPPLICTIAHAARANSLTPRSPAPTVRGEHADTSLHLELPAPGAAGPRRPRHGRRHGRRLLLHRQT